MWVLMLQNAGMLLDRFSMWGNGVTGYSGIAQVDFKLMKWPAFGSNFPVNGLTGCGGMWSSCSMKREKISVKGLTELCGMD
ncbi:hypothetical protein Nepgr_024649 [Nepenthes gracilis]|uniref:Uncharacterized protein n=1 Tax=Nepenthes gracilis TaxID=150966 RepID=A0AAD3T6C0_NEPGR|nr:hypothetical protein Nepgr_024649 [Nepenthes gracilis]